MPNSHSQQGESNLHFAAGLPTSDSTSRQWACIAAFHATVHAIRHAAIASGLDQDIPARTNSHAWDDWWMREYAPGQYGAYRSLRQLSEECRYRLRDVEPPTVTESLERARILIGRALDGSLPAPGDHRT